MRSIWRSGGRRTRSTFSEVPLTLGLIFAEPSRTRLGTDPRCRRDCGRRAAAPAGEVGVQRRAVRARCRRCGTHLPLVLGSANPVEPRGWLAGLAAIALSHLVGAAAVSSGHADRRRACDAAKPGLGRRRVVQRRDRRNCGRSRRIGSSVASNSWSWVLLLLIGGALGYFFISFVRIRERHNDLSTLHGFTTSLNANTDPLVLGEIVVVGLSELLARVAGRAPVRRQRMVSSTSSFGTVRRRSARSASTPWTGRRVAAGSQASTSVAQAVRPLQESLLLNSSAISAPLPLPDRAGLVLVDGRLSAVRAFDDEDVQLLETAAGHAAAALHSAQLVDKLREEARFRAHQALHDDVTDLPNQRSLRRAARRGSWRRERVSSC